MKKITTAALMLTLASALSGALVSPALADNPDLDLQVSFDMVLTAMPDVADQYVQLQRDVEQLQTLQKEAMRNQRFAMMRYGQYDEKSQNDYNLNDSFRLFRQLDQKEVQQSIRASSRDLNRVQRKLDERLAELAELKQQVKLAYIRQNMLSEDQLKQRMLDGEPVSLLPSQHTMVLNFLKQLADKPEQLAKALENPGVSEILPDNIKEQLQVFRDSGVPLQQALARPRIMEVVINNLTVPMVASRADQADQQVISVYRSETAFADLDPALAPMTLGSFIDAQVFEINDLVELYDLPVPSRDVIEATQ
ncbi:hypothetical protein [Oceanobacter mangrovi]|uniref:hypothetical protein n=1 Tax=Oceanobacter mangrovi TaxID=2862510 RepID=UPI001C8EE053|nr:hypothetical protein [Oceanobacter mangrovi]